MPKLITGVTAKLPGVPGDLKKQPAPKKRRTRARKGVKTESERRSIEFLRKAGWHAEICSQNKAHFRPPEVKGARPIYMGQHTNDLFGAFDILAFRADSAEVLAVQSCRRGEIKAHIDKYREDPEVAKAIRDWLAQPGRAFVIHGWEAADRPTKDGKGTVRRWEVKEVRVVLADISVTKADAYAAVDEYMEACKKQSIADKARASVKELFR